MNYADKFNATNDYLVNAILEKMLGRLPSKEELRANLKISFDPDTYENTVYYKDVCILVSCIKPFDGVGIGGYFSVPEEYNDEWIQEKINNWSK